MQCNLGTCKDYITCCAEDVEGGSEGARGRLGAPQPATAAAPNSAAATEGDLAAATTVATSKEAMQPSDSNRNPGSRARLGPFGLSAPNTIGRLPFRQGWADFGRVTTAVLADEPPSASMYMDPQPLTHMPPHLAGAGKLLLLLACARSCRHACPQEHPNFPSVITLTQAI